jgi:uncharacterized protein with PIN domain
MTDDIPMSRPKFIVDMNVGKLAPWLRALGYDTVFINPIDDGELVRIAETEGRIVLTKDAGILERRVVTSGTVQVEWIESYERLQQLKQVVEHFKLDRKHEFTRCMACNTMLQAAPLDEALPHVPPRTAAVQDAYWYCPHCQQYFWQGSHWKRMNRVFDSLLAGH